MKAQAVAARVQVRRSRHLGAYVDPKTASARRTVELFPEVVQLLREIQPLRVTPEMPVFTNNIRGGPIEPNALLFPPYRRARPTTDDGLLCLWV